MIQTLSKSVVFNLIQLQDAVLQLTNNDFTTPLDILSGSTLGMHVRHILEFYECMINGEIAGVIDYDGRKRNLMIENDKAFAIHIIQNHVENISLISENKTMVLLTSQTTENKTIEINTNTFRELTYLIEHTIHHMAMLKIAFKIVYPHIELSEEFGVAYSTLKYKKIVYSNLSTAS
jgi:uncharacterized pyridoxamine 5'-phosphate oxidase family protein